MRHSGGRIAGRPVPNPGQQTYRFAEGTLLIELYDRQSREMVWRGIYRDDQGNAERLAEKLPEGVEKLLEEFPPEEWSPHVPVELVVEFRELLL